MTFTYQATSAGYANLWAKAQVRQQHADMAHHWATVIGDPEHRPRYEAVQARTGVPWFFIGLLHMREGSCNLGTYLGNGEPLHSVTHLVPANRGPFATFEDGAVDALKYEGFIGITDWPISRLLWAAEKFNGDGYFGIGINSPYVWSWTNLYSIGKYDGDRHYNAGLVDPQPGVAAILKTLIAINPNVAAHFATHKESPAVTSTPAPAQVSDPIPQIISMLESAQKILPMVSAFMPPPIGSVIVIGVPIAEELLQLIEDMKTKSGTDLISAIGTHLQTIGQHFQTAGATVQQAQPATVNPLGMG